MIIGITGFIGSGKDTLADFMVSDHGFRRDSFANSLKDAVSSIFGWDREMLEGRTKSARAEREKVDAWWAERLGIANLTPRLVLQQVGTEVFRQNFHDDIWIASLERKLSQSKDNVVITDCRFPNELKAIKNAGGIIVHVTRGALPDYYTFALTANAHQWNGKPQTAAGKAAEEELVARNIHPSEWAWIGAPFDFVADNNGSIEDLYRTANTLAETALPGTPVTLRRDRESFAAMA